MHVKAYIAGQTSQTKQCYQSAIILRTANDKHKTFTMSGNNPDFLPYRKLAAEAQALLKLANLLVQYPSLTKVTVISTQADKLEKLFSKRASSVLAKTVQAYIEKVGVRDKLTFEQAPKDEPWLQQAYFKATHQDRKDT